MISIYEEIVEKVKYDSGNKMYMETLPQLPLEEDGKICSGFNVYVCVGGVLCLRANGRKCGEGWIEVF